MAGLKKQHVLETIDKALVIGDTHGNTAWAKEMVKEAVKRGCKVIFQLGDFGIWPGSSGDYYLHELNKALDIAGIDLFFVDGNHEDFPKLFKLTKRRTDYGFGHVAIPYNDKGRGERLFHIPRGLVFKVGDKTFMGMGGGVSIDRNRRVPGKSWWPQEQITVYEAQQAMDGSYDKEIDVLLTHDCPVNVPMVGLKTDFDSQAHRQRISEIAKTARPKLWMHGHMHHYMEYEYDGIRVVGLNRDTDPHYDSGWNANAFGVLDIKTLEFQPEHLLDWDDHKPTPDVTGSIGPNVTPVPDAAYDDF